MRSRLRLICVPMGLMLFGAFGCQKNHYRPPPYPVVAPAPANCPNCPPQSGFTPAPGGFAPNGFSPAPNQVPVTPANPNPPAIPRTGPAISQYPSLPPDRLDQAAAKLRLPDGFGSGVESAVATGPLDMPTEIPRFALVSDKTAAGLVPFSEGYTWLKNQGYRTVLFIKAPDQDDEQVRGDATRVGLKVITLDVAPGQLTREQVELFARHLVEESPIFVCDQTGERAGTLWYLYFRMIEGQGEDLALARAKRLGLRDPADGGSESAEQLWHAMRKLAR